MIVYQSTKSGFIRDTFDHAIEAIISDAWLKRTGRYAPHAEVQAWQNSLESMAMVLDHPDIEDDVGIGVEFGIPQTAKRMDFLLTGRDESGRDRLVIVELKQWSDAKVSEKDGIIIARRGGRSGEIEGPHPSYQAWSYAALLEGFSEAVYEGNVGLGPCAYLHNFRQKGVLDDPRYAEYLKLAPVFLRGGEEKAKLRAFIRQHVRHGDKGELLYRIENGRIRPSKMLADSLASMLKGNREFVLVDDQKLVFETALELATKAQAGKKRIAIVRGGPGTGKSVVAINLLSALTSRGLNARYVSKNAAPRAVYAARLTGHLQPGRIHNLFSGSGAFTSTEPDTFDCLVVDEAHRLNEGSGRYGNLGEHQVKEVIAASRSTIFFVDDDQIVTFKDVGHSGEIERWAKEFDAEVIHLELASQFRCNGSDGYLAWLDNTLGIRETANTRLDPKEFNLRLFDSPAEMHAEIERLNKVANRARVVAGYCWNWVSKRNPDAWDIEIPEFGYRRQWNLTSDGSLWLVAPTSVKEVGCIHTCQGLELDYVGVIIGPDLAVRDGQLVAVPQGRATSDHSLRGYKTLMSTEPERTRERADRIIRNTYRTLMTRGMKGCFVYCTDPAVRDYLANRIG